MPPRRPRASTGLALAAAAAWAAACGGRHVGGSPSWRAAPPPTTSTGAPGSTAAPPPLRLAPADEGASAYNAPPFPAPRASPLGDAITAAVAQAATVAHRPAPAPDGRLFAVADALAEVVPTEGTVPYPLVEFALQHHGILEPSPHLIVIWGEPGAADAIVDELATRLPPVLGEGHFARLGVGSAHRGGELAIVVALQDSFLETAPVPRRVRAGGSTPLEGRVLPPYRDPEVFVTRDDGSVGRSSIDRDGQGGFRGRIDCSGRRGRQQVEIEARDDWGAEVLANFPVWCGEAPPTELTVAPNALTDVPPANAAAGEAELLALVNETRAASGLPPLTLDPELTAVARAHSEDMAHTGIVGHVSPTTGTAADRVRAAGIRTGLVLENVARAYGVREAHEGLLNSPGHRANLMSKQATHIGIGVHLGAEVAGRPELLVTQVFTRVPPVIDRAAARAHLRARVHVAARLADNETLDAVAQRMADDMAGGAELEAAVARSNTQLSAARRIQRANTLSTVVADLDDFDVATVAAQTGYSHVGVGVAQGTHAQIGPGAIFVVVIVAQIR